MHPRMLTNPAKSRDPGYDLNFSAGFMQQSGRL
jgi:hypothetical protein